MKHRILIIDCSDSGHELRQLLLNNNIDVQVVRSISQGVIKIDKEYYDLCLLLSDEVNNTIIHAIERIKESISRVSVFFIGTGMSKRNIISVYKAGVADVFDFPLDMDIMFIKILNVVKNFYKIENMKNEYAIGNYSLNYRLRELIYNNEINIKLTPKECDLLRVLVDSDDILVTKNHILKLIWKKEDYFTGKCMDVYINRLRKHLLLDNAITIENIRDSGYRLLVR